MHAAHGTTIKRTRTRKSSFVLHPSRALSLSLSLSRNTKKKRNFSKDDSMDLDLWISKVKEGNHLMEDELQLLCEYVSFRSSSSSFPSQYPFLF